MPSSLGIYIDGSMVKYAKITKEKDSIKIDNFNVLFYDNLSKALEQIVDESNSSKIPICTNIGNEIYGYAEVFSELSKKDIKSSVQIEFEMDCSEKNYNKDTLEMRFMVMTNQENNEKYKALYIATEKAEISKRAQGLAEYKLEWMTPISRDIVNLIDVNPKDNFTIINIEDETKITTVLNGAVASINAIDIGMKDILAEINKTENSLAKSYDICKNITVYTQDMQGQTTDNNEHLEDVMPTLYKLVNECKKILDGTFGNVSRVYLTGSATVINNIDLYFQEYIPNVKIELLRPYFLEGANVKSNLKDYIEVNSAMALAMNALGVGLKDVNYATAASAMNSDIKAIFKKIKNQVLPVGSKKKDENNKEEKKEKRKISIDTSFSGPFTPLEKLFVRGTATALVATVGFIAFSGYVSGQIEVRKEEIASTSSLVQKELDEVDNDYTDINLQTSNYRKMIAKINELNNPTEDETKIETPTVQERIISKDAIPNLLTRIMTKIPQKVQVTSIQNTEDTHIVIEAQSSTYEQLGYFKGLITTNNILTDVKSTSGIKDGDNVKITIEGELPWV